MHHRFVVRDVQNSLKWGVHFHGRKIYKNYINPDNKLNMAINWVARISLLGTFGLLAIFPRPATHVYKFLDTCHDSTENACTVSTSRCPIQSLRKVF